MARRVLLHVGAPKTGTSFVQDLLFTHRDALAGEGLLYPADRFDAHFLAALDLMQLPWGGLEKQTVGAWAALAAQVRAWPDVAVVSHEILGRASRVQVRRALDSLGDAEVHLVVSARDLVRQLPAEWQENVKHRRTLGYGDFLARVRDPARSSEIAQWFWSVQEIPDVLDRWGSTLPKDRIHLVTVPPAGSPRGLLWERFAQVLGIDPTAYVPTTSRANASLGVAESALVRRLNERLNLTLPNHHYRQFVRELMVHQNLSTSRGSPRLTVPPDVAQWAADLSRLWVTELALRGYDVVGDLDDLLPVDRGQEYADPDTPDEAEVAAAGVRALAGMVQEAARLRDVEVELHEVIEDLMRQLDAAHSTRVYKAKERLVSMADTNPVARAGLGAYRRLRGSSSRPE